MRIPSNNQKEQSHGAGMPRCYSSLGFGQAPTEALLARLCFCMSRTRGLLAAFILHHLFKDVSGANSLGRETVSSSRAKGRFIYSPV